MDALALGARLLVVQDQHLLAVAPLDLPPAPLEDEMIVEGISAFLIGLSIWWYPAHDGWRRAGAPPTQIAGCGGFIWVAVTHELWIMGALNAALIVVNLINFNKSRLEEKI